MNRDDMLSIYQRLIQMRFESAHVIIDERFTDEYDIALCALGISDDRRAEFTVFILNEVAPDVEAAGYRFVGVMPYSWDDARIIFPKACDQFYTKAIQSFNDALMNRVKAEPWKTATSSMEPMVTPKAPIRRTATGAGRDEVFHPLFPNDHCRVYSVVNVSTSKSSENNASLRRAA